MGREFLPAIYLFMTLAHVMRVSETEFTVGFAGNWIYSRFCLKLNFEMNMYWLKISFFVCLQGSPTKELPSPTKEKKKKKKFRIPSFSKKKSKESKESAI